MAAEEIMMICIDNSEYMRLYDPYRFKLQLDCIRSYSDIKLKSNRKNEIGIVTMGTKDTKKWLSPTSDLDIILCITLIISLC
ncbi:26S proteasome non-ATPase regulatory subunit 4 homolog isoform X2 [Rutidosis leptorrhynchoides]|uniref:26S proteasome non-ATPase regulatory subunit 4 homolog isoform X2 n=1 Tax=Rutidosis leptorrhynchoides TaxID=125765 RepID=UPI003A99CF11